MSKTQGRNEAKQRDILSNFEGELPTTSMAQSNSQCLLASFLMWYKQISEGSFLPDSQWQKLFRDALQMFHFKLDQKANLYD